MRRMMAIKMKITERQRTPKQNPNENSRGESEIRISNHMKPK